jgi:hypothetical protein
MPRNRPPAISPTVRNQSFTVLEVNRPRSVCTPRARTRLASAADGIGVLVEQVVSLEPVRQLLPGFEETTVFTNACGPLSGFVSMNTIKTQTQSLYRKLGATSREQVLAIAAELALISGMPAPAEIPTPSEE